MSVDTNMINRDELIGIAHKVESLSTLMNEIMLNYFDPYDRDKPEDRTAILLGYSTYRRHANICFDIVMQTMDELHEHGIYWYPEYKQPSPDCSNS